MLFSPTVAWLPLWTTHSLPLLSITSWAFLSMTPRAFALADDTSLLYYRKLGSHRRCSIAPAVVWTHDCTNTKTAILSTYVTRVWYIHGPVFVLGCSFDVLTHKEGGRNIHSSAWEVYI